MQCRVRRWQVAAAGGCSSDGASSGAASKQQQSSWDAKSGREGVEGADVLYELGASQQVGAGAWAALRSPHCLSATYLLFTAPALAPSPLIVQHQREPWPERAVH